MKYNEPTFYTQSKKLNISKPLLWRGWGGFIMTKKFIVAAFDDEAVQQKFKIVISYIVFDFNVVGL